MRNCVLFGRALERLEPYEGKLSCTVLRGGVGGNTTPLPGDGRDETTKAAYKRLAAWGKEAHLVSFRRVRRPGDKPELANFMPPIPTPKTDLPVATIQDILF